MVSYRGLDKLSFGYTINDQCDHLPKSRGDCFDYGIISGCDCDCPALNGGECKEFESVIESIRHKGGIEAEHEEELKKIYKK